MSDQSEHGHYFPAVEDAAECEPVTIHIGEGLVIRPGDTLIIRLNTADVTAAEVFDLQARLHLMFPDVRGVVFAADGQMAVQRGPQLDDPARPLVDHTPRMTDEEVEQLKADWLAKYSTLPSFNLAPLPESQPFVHEAR
jgi:hypothetical protein